MTALERPDHIKVGPLDYRVTDDSREWAAEDIDLSDHYGYTDHRRGLIFIDAGEASASMVPVILMHEVMHAAAFAAGQLDSRKHREEDWVVMVAPVLVQILIENPSLARYLVSRGVA